MMMMMMMMMMTQKKQTKNMVVIDGVFFHKKIGCYPHDFPLREKIGCYDATRTIFPYGKN